jgi:hypothetical protein
MHGHHLLLVSWMTSGRPDKACPCAQATVQLTPLLWTQLKKLGDDLYGVNGLANVPTTDAEFLTRLKNIVLCAPRLLLLLRPNYPLALPSLLLLVAARLTCCAPWCMQALVWRQRTQEGGPSYRALLSHRPSQVVGQAAPQTPDLVAVSTLGLNTACTTRGCPANRGKERELIRRRCTGVQRTWTAPTRWGT